MLVYKLNYLIKIQPADLFPQIEQRNELEKHRQRKAYKTIKQLFKISTIF